MEIRFAFFQSNLLGKILLNAFHQSFVFSIFPNEMWQKQQHTQFVMMILEESKVFKPNDLSSVKLILRHHCLNISLPLNERSTVKRLIFYSHQYCVKQRKHINS